MKRLNSAIIFLAAALTSQAALVHFDISPAGSDTAVGLSPSNTVPKAIRSQGSGGEVSGGIVFDTDTSVLQLAVGYGSAAGFSDLTGPAIKIQLNGPAPVGDNAPALVDLESLSFPSAVPKHGGVVLGAFVCPAEVTTALLAGKIYLHVLTEEYPNGEIRGQLIPLDLPNRAPLIRCPDASTVECGTPAEVKVAVSDPDGDALVVVWKVNRTAVQTNLVRAGKPPTVSDVTFAADLPLGENVVGVTVTDTAGNSATCSTIVKVVDTKGPVIRAAAANPANLWPPNHKMVNVTVNARVVDNCGVAGWKIIGVRSNEPADGLGDGDTAPDWEITGNNTVNLRAERSGTGRGRIYTIAIQAKDRSGNFSEVRTVTVTVDKSQSLSR